MLMSAPIGKSISMLSSKSSPNGFGMMTVALPPTSTPHVKHQIKDAEQILRVLEVVEDVPNLVEPKFPIMVGSRISRPTVAGLLVSLFALIRTCPSASKKVASTLPEPAKRNARPISGAFALFE